MVQWGSHLADQSCRFACVSASSLLRVVFLVLEERSPWRVAFVRKQPMLQ